jgi:hypothetical protein
MIFMLLRALLVEAVLAEVAVPVVSHGYLWDLQLFG